MVKVEYVYGNGETIGIETDAPYSPDIALDLAHRLVELAGQIGVAEGEQT